MAISQNRYVDIQTTIEPKSNVTRKDLIARFYTNSEKLSTGEIVVYYNLDSVGEKFTVTSDEYKFAQKYFGYLSKARISPTKIAFANFQKVGRKPSLTPTIDAPKLASFTAITDGAIKINLAGVATDITALDFSSATDLAGVATVIQTAIRSVTANGDDWTQATVEFKTGVGFVLTGGTESASNIGYATAAESGTDIASLLGWNETSAPTLVIGMAAETPVECLTRTMKIDSNCGSFAFVQDLTTDEIAAVATWNNAQGVQFMYSAVVDETNYQQIYNLTRECQGTALTYATDKYACYMPMAIMAATNYEATNGTMNYMFVQFDGETPAVTTDSKANELDNMRINYYGQTQTFGQALAFYQRGYLQGAFADMGAYANEIWLKSAIEASCLTLLLARNKIPANDTGRGVLRTNLQTVIDDAINNGTILAGKALTSAQKSVVLELTNDDAAVNLIEQTGYWLNVETVELTVNGALEYHLQYTLVYSKGDSIRKIVGYDIVL